jgi:hypothetical protein
MFQKGNTYGFSATKQPVSNGRKHKNHLVELMDKIGNEVIEVELVKGQGKTKMTREEAMIRGWYQNATKKGGADAENILNRRYGKVKDRLELSEKNVLQGPMGELSRMTAAQMIAARPDLVRLMLDGLKDVENAQFEEVKPLELENGQSVSLDLLKAAEFTPTNTDK